MDGTGEGDDTAGEVPVLRSLLSVPVLQPRFVEKAATVPADAIVFDLEDSIAPAEKAAARQRPGSGSPTCCRRSTAAAGR